MNKEKKELIYFWFRNEKIFKQDISINFSRKYNCSYEYTSGILTVAPSTSKDDTINFFGHNITFTTLVGENGTGKSSILKLLNSILENYNKKQNFEEPYLILFSDGSCKSNNIEIIDKSTFINENTTKSVFVAHFDSETASTSKKMQKNIDISNDSVLEFMFANYLHKDENNFKIFLFKPKYIEIKPIKLESLILRFQEELTFKLTQISTNTIIEQFFKEYFNFITLIRKLSSFDTTYQIFILSKYLKDKDSLTELIEEIDSLDDYDDNEKYIEFLSFLNTFDNHEHPLVLKNIDEDRKVKIMNNKEFFSFDFLDEKYRRYSNLSHGEKTAFALFIHIDEIIRDFYREPCIILLDEPELSLHPNWQRLLISDLINNFSNKKNFIHFITATHSPFLLSDMPSDSIVYLNSGGINHDRQSGIKTFGANIYTLLDDTFYMQDGAMGKFAEEQIQNVIDFLTEKETRIKTKEEALYIIKQIGEDFLRENLLTMYNRKYQSKD